MAEQLTKMLAEDLEQEIWSLPSGDLVCQEPSFLARARDAGVPIETSLTDLAEESLTLAYQKGVLKKLVIQELLVNRCERPLIAWFSRQTGNRELAQDLTHAVYLKLLDGGLLSYDTDHEFFPWLWAVARHLLIEYYRRAANRPPAAITPDELPAQAPGPDELARVQELRQRLEQVAAQFSEEFQRVLWGLVAGLKPREMAAQWDWPLQRVYKVRHQVRQAVKRALDEEHPSPLVGS